MKNSITTFLSVILLSTATIAQSTDHQDREKNSSERSESKKDQRNDHDSTQNISPHDRYNKNKVQPKSDAPENSPGVRETVKPKQKRNLPGKRSENDEDETGKNGGKTDRDLLKEQN